MQLKVEEHQTAEAADAFINSGLEVEVFSQASLIVEAQKAGLCFQDWGPLIVF